MKRIAGAAWRRFPGRAVLACVVLSLALSLPGAWVAQADAQSGPLEELSAFPQAKLTIRGGGASHEFTLWVADTPAREEQGLMFVRELAADRGMVFFDTQPRPWSMWMRNTYIPLDMLFIGPDGRISSIAHALPHDETIIRSGGPVKAVIELQAGVSEKLHLKVGDTAVWK